MKLSALPICAATILLLGSCTGHRRGDAPVADGDTIEVVIGDEDNQAPDTVPQVTIIEVE